jgi:hypothetical protein
LSTTISSGGPLGHVAALAIARVDPPVVVHDAHVADPPDAAQFGGLDSRARAELLHEHRDTGGAALLNDGACRADVERPRAGAALAADDHPVDAVDIEVVPWQPLAQIDRPEQRLDRQEAHGRRRRE